MGKMLLTGVDGNLGGEAARILLEIAPHDQLIFTAYSEASLAPYAEMGVETHVTGFNDPITVRYMFEHVDGYQIGERHSKDS